jgi:hypothetical protein
MDSIGAVAGYCAIWGEASIDISPRGSKMPWHEVIERGSLSFSPCMTANTHHFEPSAFAFSSDDSLKVGKDSAGLWFVASLPPTSTGYDVFYGLGGGRALAVSIEFNDATWRGEGPGINVLARARMTGVSILRPGKAAYQGTRCWLDGDTPQDPQTHMLYGKFARSRGSKPEPIVFPPEWEEARVNMARAERIVFLNSGAPR